ncbi:Dabb family protein [Gordonia sp. HNM0687]|uniref:Dabb family protein n=1 Tax=Gordonia mangrovi TaxID=2665643 RepID=A0A6L7GXP7_9ACTN|nr:Dabb family protein [Gordonia mangrovi]MXP23871.1 Dabb family protein [Gordonia mangrovi]UVF76425.1 Dabb family protein [Gordonia mangrovi]
MIYHGIRFTFRDSATQEQIDTCMDSLRNQGESIPAVSSYVVGRDFGGEYEYGAIYALPDLDGYWEYLIHPSHLNSDKVGLPHISKFVSFDVTDESDPDVGTKIAALHQRRYDEMPWVSDLVAGLDDYAGSAAPGDHGSAT